MKKPLTIIGSIEAAIMLVAIVVCWMQSGRYGEFAIAIGFFSLIMAVANIVVGFIVTMAGLSNEPVKNVGLAFLICGGILLLAGFTFCGTGLANGGFNV